MKSKQNCRKLGRRCHFYCIFPHVFLFYLFFLFGNVHGELESAGWRTPGVWEGRNCVSAWISVEFRSAAPQGRQPRVAGRLPSLATLPILRPVEIPSPSLVFTAIRCQQATSCQITRTTCSIHSHASPLVAKPSALTGSRRRETCGTPEGAPGRPGPRGGGELKYLPLAPLICWQGPWFHNA